MKKVALTIAGLDPSGGAGILADTQTFAAFNCRPAAVITSITFQNASGVYGAVHQTAETVRAQLMPLLPVACVKTGMLPTREIVVELARMLREQLLVIDPVMRSTSGYELIDEAAITSLQRDLMPLARLVTPNIPEAEKLTGGSIEDEADMRRAAETIRATGVAAVLIKGGHLENESEVVDVLDDRGKITVFRGPRLRGTFRGTGCRLASAIAACLAHGASLEQSVQRARDFLISNFKSEI